jgi:hypothetical protein
VATSIGGDKSNTFLAALLREMRTGCRCGDSDPTILCIDQSNGATILGELGAIETMD